MPRISSSEIMAMTKMAGRLTMPWTLVPSASVAVSKGEMVNCAGRVSPHSCSSDTT